MFQTREEEKEQEELFKLEDAEFTYPLQDVEEVVLGITDCINFFFFKIKFKLCFYCVLLFAPNYLLFFYYSNSKHFIIC